MTGRALVFQVGIPRYLQIAEALRARIRGPEGNGQGRLPSEHALCAEFGVSRPTIRQALDLLLDEGLLTRRRGRGTFVALAPAAGASLRVIGSIEDMIALGNETRYRPLEQSVVRPPAPVARALRLAKNARVIRLVGVRYQEDAPFRTSPPTSRNRWAIRSSRRI